MREIAQYGVAAHWKYKLSSNKNNIIDTPEIIKKIFDIQTLNDPKEFIDAVKDELITNLLYIYTKRI